uniref:uncharacterized protein ppp1r18 n=1 Tax=Monopterus albus TaxID=43700 RepID=UPI0009B40177|nr:uncharacterized protein LOC109958816 [Monopterus albus]
MFISVQHRSNVKKAEPVDKRDVEKSGDTDRDEGFMVTSVTNTEVISFARRVPIRQDRKARAEREVKRWAGEKSLERGVSVEKDCESREQIEAQFGDKKAPDLCQEKGFESLIPAETRQNCVMTTRADAASPCHTAESQYKHEPAFTGLLCAVTLRAGDPHSRPEWSSTGPYLTHTALSHHTEDLMSKTEKTEDTTVNSNEKEEKAYKTVGEMTNECKQEGHYSNINSECIIHDETARCPKEITPVGNPPGPLEIQIPRTVFYIAEEIVERKKTLCQNIDGKNWEGMQGVEKRDRWRIGKPLSCIESLREKIRQRELESLRQRETQDSDGSEAVDISDTQTDLDMYDKRGTEIEKEWEAAAHMQKRLVEVETGQEDAAAQISMAAFDVTQEVSVLKTCPQLPVSVLHSQAVRREEVIRRYTAAACEVVSDSSQIPEHEDDPPKHVEEQLTCHRGRHEGIEEREEDKKELSVEEVGEDTSPLDPTQSLSSSPVHPNSLAAMSRIYNLETVGSRSGLCLRERTVDVSSVHLVKVKPLISNAQQGDSKAFTGEDKRGVQSIQRQIEQFQLKEKEALKSCSSPKSFLKDRETKGQQSPTGVSRHQVKDDVKTQEKAQEKAEINLNMSPQHVCSSTSPLKQTITINPSRLRSPSPDSSLKPSDCAPTPASSPSSASPVQSPSVSPFPTPSPTLFSIRSASGGQVKRGATITITPRKPTAGGGGDATGSSTGSTAAGLAPAKAPLQQAQMTPTETEPAKKKYPTVDEIKVIGGYQNLEKSCLVKNRGTPKRVKVCFIEDQLEQVCEYPSEASMLASTPYPHDLGRIERLQGKEEQEEDDEVEEAAIVSKGTRNVAIAVRRV